MKDEAYRRVPEGRAMTDTPPEMDERYRAMLMSRSDEERLVMGCNMRDGARALVEASLREQDPAITPAALRQGICLRCYGPEFDPVPHAKILSSIAQAARAEIR